MLTKGEFGASVRLRRLLYGHFHAIQSSPGKLGVIVDEVIYQGVI